MENSLCPGAVSNTGRLIRTLQSGCSVRIKSHVSYALNVIRVVTEDPLVFKVAGEGESPQDIHLNSNVR